MKLRLPGGFSDALNRCAIDFYPEVKVRGQRSRSEVRGQRSEVKVKVKVRGPKPNFLFRASFDVKLRPSGAFFDALNGSAIDFYPAAQFGVKF